MTERIRSIAAGTPAAYAQPMAKSLSEDEAERLAVKVDPYSAKVMRDRGTVDGRPYYRIRLAGQTVPGTPGRYTPTEVRDRMIDLVRGEQELQRQAEAVKRAAAEPWTVRKLMAAWVETVVRHMGKQATRANTETMAWRLAVAGGDLRLDRITGATLRRLTQTLADPALPQRVAEARFAAKNSKRRNAQRAGGYSGRTINVTMTALTAAWRWAAELGHAPATMPQISRVGEHDVNVSRMPTRAEVSKVVEHFQQRCPRHPIAAVLQLQLACGARIREVARLRMRQVERIEGEGHADPRLDTRIAWVRLTKTKTGERLVPFRRGAAGLIAALHDPSEPEAPLYRFHSGQCAGRPVSRRFEGTITSELYSLDWQALGVERFGTHGLRDRFINDAMDAGVPIDLVAKYCGNSPATILKHYRRIRATQLVDVVDRVDGLADGTITPLRAWGER